MNKLLANGYIFGNVTYYGFFIAISIVIGAVAGYYISQRRGYPKDTAIDMAMWAVPIAVVCTRLYYILFKAFEGDNMWGICETQLFGKTFKMWEPLAIWEGGVAIYGAILGAILGLYLLSLMYKRNRRLGKKIDPATGRPVYQPGFHQLCDVGAPFLILGQAIGRIGCYFDPCCCYGKEVSKHIFPFTVVLENGEVHLANFFYESAWCFIGFGLLLWLSLRKKQQFPGFLAAFYMVFYAVGRFVLEMFRAEEQTLWLIPGALKASMFVAIVFFIWGSCIFAYNYAMKYRPEQTKRFLVKLKLRKEEQMTNDKGQISNDVIPGAAEEPQTTDKT